MTTKNNPSPASPTAGLLDIGGYKPSADPASHRLIMVYTGDPGTGKTDRALTAPDPIVLFDIDHGSEGVIERAVKAGKDITVFPVSWPDEAPQSDYKAIWMDTMLKFKTAVGLLKGTGGTIIWDTFTELVELAEWAFVGRINEIMPTKHKQYQAPLRAIVRTMLDDTQLNGIFIHKWGLVFNKTNEYEIKGYKDMMYQVQAVVQLTLDERNGQRGQKMIKCRQNGGLQGKALPAGPFSLVSAMVWE
jgi:hypothetical protein